MADFYNLNTGEVLYSVHTPNLIDNPEWKTFDRTQFEKRPSKLALIDGMACEMIAEKIEATPMPMTPKRDMILSAFTGMDETQAAQVIEILGIK